MSTTNPSLEETLKPHCENIHWGTTSRSEIDFRSDVLTTPSLGMLQAMATTSLGDDVFREDQTTLAFESHIANLCGKEAGAFVVSGTMGNQLALATLCTQLPYGILADSRAHILNFEGGGVGVLGGALVQTVSPSNGRHFLTLEDIKQQAVITDDVHKCPTAVISLENTMGGTVAPLAEMRRISEWAHRHGIRLHLDGARLWEAVATGAGSLGDYCKLFDLVSVDFSKNLGAPMGAMVLGSKPLIARLRRIRKSIGGGMRQSGPLAAAAWYAVDEQFGSGVWGSRDKLRLVHEQAKIVGSVWETRGGKLLRPVETNIVWLDLREAGIDRDRWQQIGKKHGLVNFVFPEALQSECRL
ncbi:hypothetical protein BBP40_000929 [Aspergillus hancockii]|nr:hypothetical protein BBP40_000929 [Aspergillus hancockii]